MRFPSIELKAGGGSSAPEVISMKRKLAILSLALTIPVIAAVGVLARRDHAAPAITTATVSRGDIVSAIAATGTVEAVTTVEVGSQVTGTIQSLNADFNSIVRKGQVLARLDPSIVQSTVEQARANLERAEADLERLNVARLDAERKLARAQDLSARQLIPRTEAEDAAIASQSAAAQVRSAEASVIQARASLRQAEVNLEKTVITSPIDGIVVARSVDVGQTVSASVSAPTLYVIAADMRSMQLKANVDEADVGRIAAGQSVTFTVDAYPNDTFRGVVEQLRLNPEIASNVVTYTAIVSAPNPELKLKPGMTANLTIEVARRSDVLRVPVAALRFRPTADIMRALDGSNGSALGAAQFPAGRTVWQMVEGTLKPIAVSPGATDGALTEIGEGQVEEGAPIVTRVAVAADAAAAPARSTSPLLGAQPPRR
jgi:HlyD family secretion protein